MSVTSNWEFLNISRRDDYSFTGGVMLKRANWQVTRKRTSNDTYTSQKGETATSLSGYNGGVTETVTAPNITKLYFSPATNWTRTTDRFIESGETFNNRPIYIQEVGTSNLPYSAMTKVIFPVLTVESSANFYWCCLQVAHGLAQSGGYLADWYTTISDDNASFIALQAIASGKYLEPSGFSTSNTVADCVESQESTACSPALDNFCWIPTGGTNDGVPIYQDATDTYGLWRKVSDHKWYITVVADIAGSPSNYFRGTAVSQAVKQAGTYTGFGTFSGTLVTLYTFYPASSQNYYETSQIVNGESVYRFVETNSPFAWALWNDSTQWVLSRLADIDGTPSNYYYSATLAGAYTGVGQVAGVLTVTDGLLFTHDTGGIFDADSRLFKKSEAALFVCESDDQDYYWTAFDTYMQKQTWTYLGPWVLA